MPPASTTRLPQFSLHPNLGALGPVQAGARLSRVKALLEYYASIHPPYRLPSRADFDPLAIPRLLPHLMLVKVDRASRRFRVKVVGNAVAMALPVPLHGRWLDDVRPEEGLDTSHMIAARHAVLDSGTVSYLYGRTPTRFSLDFANLEYAHCPLAEDGVQVDHVLTVYQSEGIARPE